VLQELATPFKGGVPAQAVNVVDVTAASTTDNDLDFVRKLSSKQFTIAARSVELAMPLPDGHLFLASLFDYQSRC